MPFQKGQSGNPGGRPKKAFTVRKNAQKYSDEMLRILVDIARNAKSEDKDRIAAATKVLEWGIGKPAVVDLEGETVADQRIEVVIPALADIEFNPQPH